jgi:hypothetical protein
MLAGIHGMLAIKLGPHWTLDDKEAKELDKAIKRVFRHQNMKVTQKQLDYAFAAYVFATIYGTRIVTTVVLARGGKQAEPVQEAFSFPTAVPGGRA